MGLLHTEFTILHSEIKCNKNALRYMIVSLKLIEERIKFLRSSVK